jgi:antitoxin component of MazEF toxin-antitoxin module
MPKSYRKVLKMGDSYYMALPKMLVTKKMIEDGVIVEVLEAKPGQITLRISEASWGTR